MKKLTQNVTVLHTDSSVWKPLTMCESYLYHVFLLTSLHAAVTNPVQEFSSYSFYQRYCLAHLFTHTAFSGGVLGLAYIGSPRTYSVGGICSPGD